MVSCKITEKNPMKFESDYKAQILCMRNADDCAIPSSSMGWVLGYCVVLLCIWFSTAHIAIKYWQFLFPKPSKPSQKFIKNIEKASITCSP